MGNVALDCHSTIFGLVSIKFVLGTDVDLYVSSFSDLNLNIFTSRLIRHQSRVPVILKTLFKRLDASIWNDDTRKQSERSSKGNRRRFVLFSPAGTSRKFLIGGSIGTPTSTLEFA